MPRRPAPAPSCPLVSASPFLDASAVEAWDAWFRWRDGTDLRDLTIDASWDRVAGALTAAEQDPSARSDWQARIRHAMGEWQLLLDPRLLASAGTDHPAWPGNDLCAALNVAAFVREPFSRWASFDRDGFRRCAGLAVRALDNALLLAADRDPLPRLRIGLIGLADAFALLGIGYASPEGIAMARGIATQLAEATLAGTVELAAERGARLPFAAERQAIAERRGTDPTLLDAATRTGLRHATLTAIDSQPRLALLANHVADAIDPLADEPEWHAIGAPGGDRHLRSAGFACNLRRRHLLASGHALPPTVPDRLPGVADQILLRAELASWIDAPIDYPYRRGPRPDPASEAEWSALAAQLRLPPLRWNENAEPGGG